MTVSFDLDERQTKTRPHPEQAIATGGDPVVEHGFQDEARRWGEALVVRVDRILPKTRPKYSEEASPYAELMADPNRRLEGTVTRLGVLIEVLLTANPLQTNPEAGKFYFERRDQRRRLDVALHPLELTVSLRSLYLLSRGVQQNPATLRSAVESGSFARQYGLDSSCLHLLAVMEKFQILDHPEYQPLANVLRREVIVEQRLMSYQQLTEQYSGRLAANQEFWEAGLQQVTDLAFPNQEQLQYQRRRITGIDTKLRQLTVANTVRQSLLPVGRTKTELTKELQSKYELRRQRHQLVEVMANQETKYWRAALSEFVDDFEFSQDSESEQEYLFRAVLIIGEHFDHDFRSHPDMDVSIKTRTTFRAIREGRAEPLYAERLRALINEMMKQRDPLLIWLLSFRNPTAAFLMQRSVIQNSPRFVDLEKLLVHHLAKGALMERYGQEELLLRQPTASDDTLLSASTHRLMGGLQYLADHYPQVGWNKYPSYAPLKEAIFEAEAAFAAGEESPVAELLTRQNLLNLTRQSALDRFQNQVSGNRVALDLAFSELRLRSTRYGRLLASHWWKDLSLSQLTFAARMITIRYFGERRHSKESQTAPREAVADLLYARPLPAERDDLDFIPLQYEDDFVRQFVSDADGITIANLKDQHKGTAANRKEAYQQLFPAIKKQSAQIYVIAAHDGRINVPFEFQFVKAIQISDEPGKWMVLVRRAARKKLAEGIYTDGLVPKSYEPYRASDTFDFEKAVAYLDTLKGNRELYLIYQDLIAELQVANLAQHGLYREVVLKAVTALQRYIQGQRFYDLNTNALTDPELDPLQYIAAHPEEGFNCLVAARVVQAFLQQVGVKVSVISGQQPYYSKGRMVISPVTGHAMCVAIFPSGQPVEIDVTPPETPDTPNEVLAHFRKFAYPGEALQLESKMNLDTQITFKQVFQKARLALAVGLFVVVAAYGVGEVMKSGSGSLGTGQPAGTPGESVPATAAEAPESQEDGRQIWEEINWAGVGLGLAAGLAGTAGFLAVYGQVEKRRRERRWREQTKTKLERNHPPNEQVVIQAEIYRLTVNQENDHVVEADIKRLLRLLKKFDWEAARPVLELTGMMLQTAPPELREQLTEHLARAEYDQAYDLVALQAYLDSQQRVALPVMIKRLLQRKPELLQRLQQHGHALMQAEQSGAENLPPADLNRVHRDTFIRSMQIVQLMQDFRQVVQRELTIFRLNQSVGEGHRQTVGEQAELTQQSRSLAMRQRRALLKAILQIERSLQADAISLVTPAELAALKKVLNETPAESKAALDVKTPFKSEGHPSVNTE